MIEIPEKITPPYTGRNILSVNTKVKMPLNRQNVMELNKRAEEGRRPFAHSSNPAFDSVRGQREAYRPVPPANRPQPVQAPVSGTVPMRVPQFLHPLRKGQKTALYPAGQTPGSVSVCFGWNIKDPRVDLDASAFLLAASGRVPGDEWFVFYGQEVSPDRSIRFIADAAPQDRERIEVDLTRLDPQIRKLVFVLTINEAFENQLNFSMLGDAYIRILDQRTRQELLSFRLEEYYSNCTSMTVGEMYLHNGQWKFNPVGNGVNQDLAGQCRIYGVEID